MSKRDAIAKRVAAIRRKDRRLLDRIFRPRFVKGRHEPSKRP
jgi:hypothetical protein